MSRRFSGLRTKNKSEFADSGSRRSACREYEAQFITPEGTRLSATALVAAQNPMTTERTQRAIEVLLDDAARQGGLLLQSQVERVLDKRRLEPAECLAVYRALDQRGLLDRRVTEDDDVLEADRSNAVNGDAHPDGEEPDQGNGSTGSISDSDEQSEPTPELLSNLPADLAEHSLLTAQEEVELGRAVRLGRDMASAIAGGTADESDQGLEIVCRGVEARERMIRSNFRLVLKVAYPYAQASSVEVDDLIQEGLIGLMRAVEKFDHSKGFRFSTYAFWWIRQAIARAIADKGDTIRLPVHVKEKVFRLKKAMRVLRRFHEGRFPSISQLADELHWPPAQVQFMLDLSRTVQVSFDAPIKDDTQTSLLDVIADEAPGPYDIVAAADEHELIERTLGTLSEREREIIIMRFGLDRISERTLEEIGQLYELTRERIRQIESKALKRLSHPERARKLRELVDYEVVPDAKDTEDPDEP